MIWFKIYLKFKLPNEDGMLCRLPIVFCEAVAFRLGVLLNPFDILFICELVWNHMN